MTVIYNKIIRILWDEMIFQQKLPLLYTEPMSRKAPLVNKQ